MKLFLKRWFIRKKQLKYTTQFRSDKLVSFSLYNKRSKPKT